jgi:hypothetical protein
MVCIEELFQRHEEGYIVGMITSEWGRAIGSSSSLVIFSEASVAKNLKNHSDITCEDYRRLGSIIGQADLIIQDGDRTLAVVVEDDLYYHYALKSTQSGRTIFLTSFRRTSEKDIRRLKNRANKNNWRILKDALP